MSVKRYFKNLFNVLLARKKHPHWVGYWEFTHYDKDGKVVWQKEVRNGLADEGEENMLDAYLRGENVPTTFYLALYNDTPTETDSLDDLTGEPSTNGYERQEIARSTVGWPTLVLDSGDFMATSKQVAFTASGGPIGPVIYMVLTDVETGTGGLLIAFADLSQSRTIPNGESLGCKIKVKQT